MSNARGSNLGPAFLCQVITEIQRRSEWQVHTTRFGGFLKLGVPFGGSPQRISIYGGPYWGPLIFGNFLACQHSQAHALPTPKRKL